MQCGNCPSGEEVREIVRGIEYALDSYVCLFRVEDAGRFTCVAENDAGQATMDIDLIVHGLYSRGLHGNGESGKYDAVIPWDVNDVLR